MYCLIDCVNDIGKQTNCCTKKYSTLFEIAKKHVSEHGNRIHESITYFDSNGDVERIVLRAKGWNSPWFEIIRTEEV